MLGVFDRSIGKQPAELHIPSAPRPDWIRTREDIAHCYIKWKSDADNTFYNFPNGNFMALSQKDNLPPQPRSIVVMDDIFCIFFGTLDNVADLRKFYGLPRRVTEAMIVSTAYQVLRDRGPCPPDHVVREFRGKYSFMLFDSKFSAVFLARDREGGVEFHWGTAADGSLVCCDDSKIIVGICGNCYTPFPQGCFFLGGYGLISFDHPFHLVKAIEHKDEKGNIRAVLFQVDLCRRLNINIPRTGSGDNWAIASSSNVNNNQNEQEQEQEQEQQFF